MKVKTDMVDTDGSQIEAFKLTILDVHLGKAVQTRDRLTQKLVDVNELIKALKSALAAS